MQCTDCGIETRVGGATGHAKTASDPWVAGFARCATCRRAIEPPIGSLIYGAATGYLLFWGAGHGVAVALIGAVIGAAASRMVDGRRGDEP